MASSSVPEPVRPGEIRLSDDHRSAARRAAEPFAEALASGLELWSDLRFDGALRAGVDIWKGDRAPVLHLDDVSAIPFLVDISGVEEYQHRARLRAGHGDLFAAVTPVTPGYEPYCRDRLELGAPGLLEPRPTAGVGPLEVARALADSSDGALSGAIDLARARGALVVHPYMGVEACWMLGRTIARAAEVPVQVLAPPPPVTWLANDKAAFDDLVRAVVGPEELVESGRSRDPAVLAGCLLELGERHERVALKRLRCASAMGNLVLDARELRRAGHAGAEREVRAFLERTQWPGDEDVLAVAWEAASLSPSTQMWIPPDGLGDPRLDGVYEQILAGPEQIFIGSRPARLPRATLERLGRSALRVAAALQRLGYAGRCSFDHLLIGDPMGEPELRFTECNGRWGGTSTPMSLVDRMVRGPRPEYRAQDFVSPALVGRTFEEVLARVGSRLWSVERQEGTFAFYNVGPLCGSGKIDVIALAEDRAAADHALEVELPALLGVSPPGP